MEWVLFKSEGITHLFRWGHFVFGVIWIGILYYFNFVQMPFFAEADASTKSSAIQKLVPRALKWFRYAALFTFLTGLVLLYRRAVDLTGGESWMSAFTSNWGLLILTGATLGTLMFLNVWLIIWPNQKIVIASTKAVASGGQADPRAAAAGTKATLASRTNTMFSVPMLFYMGAAPHLGMAVSPDVSTHKALGVVFAIILALELNAIFGKLHKPMQSVVGIIHCGVVLTAVIYVLQEILTK
jgi:uncharacterized membrane protein